MLRYYKHSAMIQENFSETMEKSSSNSSDILFPVLKQPLYMIIIYSFAYAVVFLTSVIGNTMVTSVVIKKRSMHSVTNYFLVNLAVADILVTVFCVPVNLMINLYNGK